MTASKRVAKELEDLQKELPKYLRNLSSEEDNVLVWHALLLPERPPYNLKAFSLCISFPREYPFRPPTVKFTTRIYHPNVDRDGRVCLPITSKENWKPATKTCQGGEWKISSLFQLTPLAWEVRVLPTVLIGRGGTADQLPAQPH